MRERNVDVREENNMAEAISDVQEESRMDETVPEEHKKRKRKKRHTRAAILLIVVFLAAAGGALWYLNAAKEPQRTVEAFLDGMQKMDFDTMESLLQSSDLSALDNADIRSAAYTEFFTTINSKMTYKIVRCKFDIQNGTAQVTARIRYIDGTEIYRETITEFLRQIVAKAFSGESLSEDETQAQLATILSEKASSLEDQFSETDIVYPVIKAGGEWKIVSLDDETVKIMSANFKSVEDEINQTLSEDSGEESTQDGSADGSTASEDAASGDGEDAGGTASETGGVINLSTDRFTLVYSRHQVEKDFAGADCLLVYYSFTNNGDSATSAMVELNISASQNGESLEAAIPESNDEAIDQYMSEIQPGETVTVCQAFSLKDLSDVTLTAGPAFDFSGVTAAQTLVLQ